MEIPCIENLVDATPANPVLAEYQSKLTDLQTKIRNVRLRQSNSLAAVIGFVVLLLAFLAATRANSSIPLFLSVAPLIGFSMALRRHIKFGEMSLELAHEIDFYERGIDRLTGRWLGKGAPARNLRGRITCTNGT